MKLTLLKEFFAGFLRTRHFARHFRRLALLESLTNATVSREVPPTLAQTLVAAANDHPLGLLERLGAHADGLSEAQAQLLREKFGLNEVEHEQPLPWWVHLWHCYKNPFNLLLTLLALISWLTDDLKAATVIFSMVVLSTLLRFWQEAKSNKAADALKAMVSNTATVMRRDFAAHTSPVFGKFHAASAQVQGAQRIELPIRQLVPGDLIVLSAGDMIPADCRVLTAKDLFVSQAAMTGESMPVEKFVRQIDPSANNPLDLDNILFMGTNVVSGAATAVVLTTGNNTYFGALAQRVSATDRAPTSFQHGVNKVSWLLIRFMFVMAPLVLFINGFTKGDWMEALLFALSIAVGLTPEMLPMIVTSTLAKGAVFLSRKKVIVKRLDAIQNFGAMDVLCTDKTGTLTQDRIILEHHVDSAGQCNDAVLGLAWLNSHHQSGMKNLMDQAVLRFSEQDPKFQKPFAYSKVDELPFDFVRRRLSIIVKDAQGDHLLVCKGAVEEMLAISSQVMEGDAVVDLDEQRRQELLALANDYNRDGFRVLLVATRDITRGEAKAQYQTADERELVIRGFLTFLDPPKETAGPALAALREIGVTVKVLTGDNAVVTCKICREVGLEPGLPLLGQDIEHMDEATLKLRVEERTVFAKLTPLQKSRVIKALQSNGHTVGFLGDGINDAPALRDADVGISVDSGTDIAKESADIILLEKSLMVLEEGVLKGRETFGNIMKYLNMTASSNFGNVSFRSCRCCRSICCCRT